MLITVHTIVKAEKHSVDKLALHHSPKAQSGIAGAADTANLIGSLLSRRRDWLFFQPLPMRCAGGFPTQLSSKVCFDFGTAFVQSTQRTNGMMEPDDFENEYAQERKPWLRNSQKPAEAVEPKGTADMRRSESETAAMSARRAREEARLKDATRRRRRIFSAGTTEERRRAHVHPSWWMPEILSQVGGMICLLGARFSHFFIPPTELHPCSMPANTHLKLSSSSSGDATGDRLPNTALESRSTQCLPS